ncbi:MAG: Trifunctional nucleotide phosphoesterase protein YfkN [Bacteroidia bacterium]|nr:Trifunctional nucleotide phosphoesterase protein YfkN [Bacteroidia bacterium]
MSSRREFIRTTLLGTAGVAASNLIPLEALAYKDVVKISILHTNDVHSRIDPFPLNDPKYPGMGGAARRAEIINQIRKEEEHVLLFDAGDIFQGTPYFNFYKGELELKLMSQMQYDAATIGNHDFDNGIEGLNKQLPHAIFPFVISNYNFNDTVMYNKTITHKIFEKGGIKIGVFGLGIELDGLVSKQLYKNTIYLDPVSKANEMSSLLKNELKCDLVLCLSHLGYEYPVKKVSDKILAESTENIDIIIGGHTHTLLDKPTVSLNKNGKEVLINQVGWAGINLGKIDLFFERNTKRKSIKSTVKNISHKQ